MSLLFESVKIKEGKLYNIHLHNERCNYSRFHLFNAKDRISLENEINLRNIPAKGLHKCRIQYEKSIEKIEITPYTIRQIHNLKILENNEIEYSYKYENRSSINKLYHKKGIYDDILIIKNDLVTDTSYCNLIFSDGNKLWTSNSPLLKGIKREQLIRNGCIRETEIHRKDIRLFKHVYLINAMIDMEDNLIIPVNNIF